jgi:glutamate formiminotransferase
VPFPLEAVPNFSEGRSAETVDALRAALAAHARVLDVHVDPDHHRSVFTVVGQEAELIEALTAGVACARDRIDLRRHEGVHPRVGVADVVPLVWLRPDDRDRAVAAGLALAERLGEELELPVFLYGMLAPERGPAFFRRGGTVELERRLAAGELVPDFGPVHIDAATGCVLVGARAPLIAFNVLLATEELAVAQQIAAVVRETGGGFPGVRSLGFPLPSKRRVQVSMNVEDWRAAPLHEIVARIQAEAAERGVKVAGWELVGLIPAGAAAAAAASPHGPTFDDSKVLEARILEAEEH